MIGAIALGVLFLASVVQQDEPVARNLQWWTAGYQAQKSTASEFRAHAAFAVSESETLDPELPLEGWTARYDGKVSLSRTGRYGFTVACEGGDATLEVLSPAGVTSSKASAVAGGRAELSVEGKSESVHLRVTFTRGRGPASVQLFWKLSGSPQGDFDLEPVPSRVVNLPPIPHANLYYDVNRVGRRLLEQKGCTNCHVPDDRQAHTVGRRSAPKLGPGSGQGTGWLERWIADPSALRHGADMPALIGTQLIPDAAEKQRLVAWLAAGSSTSAPVANETQVLLQGRSLYHRLGCVACHGALESPAVVLGSEILPTSIPEAVVPAPFGDLTGKWRAKELSDFLRDPRQRFPDGRMPSFELSASEADLLATYLVSRWGTPTASPAVATPPPASLQVCAACHEIEGIARQPASRKTLAQLGLGGGCLDRKDTTTPRYTFLQGEDTILGLGIGSAQRATGVPAPHDRAERAFQSFNCGACHARDGRGGVPEELRPYFTSSDERVDIGDEGRIPPDLSDVGFKLTTKWMTDVLTKSARARPYLSARMPQFGAEHVGFLARVLAYREGVKPDEDARDPEATDERVQTGRALMGRGAHGCITCHSYKDSPSGGTPGPRLDQFAERLRYAWFTAYMPDPARYKPGTRMPAFQRKGKSSVASVLDGDFHAQSDAMWSYFTLGEFMPAPPDIEGGSRGMRVVVGDKPIVLRAFLADVGARAIAVGMPSGLHYAFDANTARLVDAWKGDFVDGGGAWAGRGGNELGGLGPVVWKAPAGSAISVAGASAPTARFRGYELDAQGVPTFLYSLGTLEVRETIRTSLKPRAKITREFVIEGLRPGDALIVDSDPEKSQVTGLEGAKLGEPTFTAHSGSRSLTLLASKVSFTLEVYP